LVVIESIIGKRSLMDETQDEDDDDDERKEGRKRANELSS